MSEKFKLDDTEYDVGSLSDEASATFNSIKFVMSRINELNNMQSLLQRAKNSYVESLKKEILSNKAGFSIDND